MNWKDITLQDLDLIQGIESSDELDFLSKVISIVTGQDKAKINQWSMAKIMKWNNRLSFLQVMPKPINKRWFWFNGVLYVRRDYKEITNGEFIDADSILSSNELEGLKMAKILRIFYRPFNKKYEGKIDNLFYQMNVQKAYSHSVFFYYGVKKHYLKTISQFLKVEMTKKANQENYQKVLQIQEAFNKLKRMMLLNGIPS